MASKTPVIRQTAWLSMIPQIVVILLLMFIFYQIEDRYFLVMAAAVYIVLGVTLRTAVPSQHRKGLYLARKQSYEEALVYFQESVVFFREHRWVDQYRYLVLLSSSRISYLEMDLINEAFCLSQMGKKAEAIQKYEETLTEFPDSQIAKTALQTLK
ncbi:MAG: hypothetical protein ABUK01_09015 [Leptospirales bacterium]